VQKFAEEVAVVTNATGEPIGFQWRERDFLVSTKPMRWFARRDWWQDATSARRGIGPGLLEVEMWWLTASCNSDDEAVLSRQYELIHSLLDGSWVLSRIYR